MANKSDGQEEVRRRETEKLPEEKQQKIDEIIEKRRRKSLKIKKKL